MSSVTTYAGCFGLRVTSSDISSEITVNVIHVKVKSGDMKLQPSEAWRWLHGSRQMTGRMNAKHGRCVFQNKPKPEDRGCGTNTEDTRREYRPRRPDEVGRWGGPPLPAVERTSRAPTLVNTRLLTLRLIHAQHQAQQTIPEPGSRRRKQQARCSRSNKVGRGGREEGREQ